MKFIIIRNKWNSLFKGEIRTDDNYLLIDTENKIVTNNWMAIQVKFRSLISELLERKDISLFMRIHLLASSEILKEKDRIFTRACEEAFDTENPKDFCYAKIN